MLGKKISNGRTVVKRHVVADVIAAFEQQPLLGARGLVLDPLGLLHGHEIFGAVDDEHRAADFRR
jgi:hypothetical protein